MAITLIDRVVGVNASKALRGAKLALQSCSCSSATWSSALRCLYAMPSDLISRRSQRRSTRVPLTLLIEIHDDAEALPAETIVVNLHGALISTSIPLTIGMTISVYVYLTDKRSMCKVALCAAESNWSNRETFGACLCRRTIGKKPLRDRSPMIRPESALCGRRRTAATPS